MMTDDDIKAAEARGYQKGYKAGSRRKARAIRDDQEYRNKSAFLDRAYLALLPVAMQVHNWTMDGKRIRTGDERVMLAAIWAKLALRQRPWP